MWRKYASKILLPRFEIDGSRYMIFGYKSFISSIDLEGGFKFEYNISEKRLELMKNSFIEENNEEIIINQFNIGFLNNLPPFRFSYRCLEALFGEDFVKSLNKIFEESFPYTLKEYEKRRANAETLKNLAFVSSASDRTNATNFILIKIDAKIGYIPVAFLTAQIVPLGEGPEEPEEKEKEGGENEKIQRLMSKNVLFHNLCVGAQFRRKNFGTLLMQKALHSYDILNYIGNMYEDLPDGEAKNSKKLIMGLDVLKDNLAARKMYLKMGFKINKEITSENYDYMQYEIEYSLSVRVICKFDDGTENHFESNLREIGNLPPVVLMKIVCSEQQSCCIIKGFDFELIKKMFHKGPDFGNLPEDEKEILIALEKF